MKIRVQGQAFTGIKAWGEEKKKKRKKHFMTQTLSGRGRQSMGWVLCEQTSIQWVGTDCFSVASLLFLLRHIKVSIELSWSTEQTDTPTDFWFWAMKSAARTVKADLRKIKRVLLHLTEIYKHVAFTKQCQGSSTCNVMAMDEAWKLKCCSKGKWKQW